MLFVADLPRGERGGDLLVLVEVGLEATRCEDLHHPNGLGTRVTQGVGEAPGLEDVGARWRDYDLASHVARQLAAQHEVALVLVGVGVGGDHHAWGEAPLLYRERTTRVLGGDLVDYVQDGKVGARARGSEDLLLVFLGSHRKLSFRLAYRQKQRSSGAKPGASPKCVIFCSLTRPTSENTPSTHFGE